MLVSLASLLILGGCVGQPAPLVGETKLFCPSVPHMTVAEAKALKWAAGQPGGQPLGPWAVRWNSFETALEMIDKVNKENKR